jgi:hypothetical protein
MAKRVCQYVMRKCLKTNENDEAQFDEIMENN